jgi:23S rRNA (uracil1939-C5)-methyltransferase
MRRTQVRIESVAFKGYGVARIDGKVVFVPYTMTRDEAWVEVTEGKKKYSTARLIQIIKPSPGRVSSPCPYFGTCGGCQWQHIGYSIQVEQKKEILVETLKRLGRLKEIPSISIAPSPKSYDYRIRVQLKVKGNTLGYYRERSHRIIDIDRCPISHPLVNRIIHNLREEMAIFPYAEGIEINVSPEEGRGVLLIYPRSEDQRMEYFVKQFLQDHPILQGIAIMKKENSNFFGDPYLNSTILWSKGGEKRSLKFRISPGSFSQVNPEQNQTLIQTVLQLSEVNKEDKVFDLYAGVGNFTLPLALGAKDVWGIDENKIAIEDAQCNAEKNGIKNCQFIQGRVEDVFLDWEKRTPDLIVLDPPRSGCKTILEQVIRWKPQKIIYVSCEPTTFARDLRLFSERGYLLQRLSLIDMFPQTYHMEVVGLLKPNSMIQEVKWKDKKRNRTFKIRHPNL